MAKEKKNRRPYHWGRSRMLRELEEGKTLTMPFESTKNYDSWRQLAYRIWRTFGAAYHCHKSGDNIEITRTA